MWFKERCSIPRIIAFVLSALIPLAAIGMGIILMVANTLFGFPFLLGYILLPLGTLLLSFLLIFSAKKPGSKIILIILLIGVFICSFVFVNMIGKFEMLDHYKGDQVTQYYPQVQNDFAYMPGLSQIGDPHSVEYYDYYSSQMAIFTCDADILVCQYDHAGYADQKTAIEAQYIFQQEPMLAHGTACEPTAQIDGYFFRILSVNGEYGDALYYPKKLLLIATNDTAQEIAFISFYNDDLDYITSLTDFILDDCGWKHIR